MSMHLHYHACEVCNYRVAFRNHGEKGLKMCPCREAYYCGEEHQKQHWRVHRYSCYTKMHKHPLLPTDVAVQYLLQFHDVALVEIAVMALLKEDVDCDFERDLERKAVVLTVEQREGEEEMAVAIAQGLIPTVRVSREVSVVSQEEEARRLDLDRSFLEHPIHRQTRMARQQLGVTIVFQPGGRVITKSVPRVQLGVWQMIQEKEKVTTNPPMLYWQIGTVNSLINVEIKEEKKRKGIVTVQ